MNHVSDDGAKQVSRGRGWFALTSVEVASKVAAAKTVIFENLFFIISSCICVEWYSLGRPERDHSSIRATGKEIDKIGRLSDSGRH